MPRALHKYIPLIVATTAETPLSAETKQNRSGVLHHLARQWERLQAICMITANEHWTSKFIFHLWCGEEEGYQCFPHRGISCGGLIHVFEHFLHQLPHALPHCFGFSLTPCDFWCQLLGQWLSSVRLLKHDFYLTGLSSSGALIQPLWKRWYK